MFPAAGKLVAPDKSLEMDMDFGQDNFLVQDNFLAEGYRLAYHRCLVRSKLVIPRQPTRWAHKQYSSLATAVYTVPSHMVHGMESGCSRTGRPFWLRDCLAPIAVPR